MRHLTLIALLFCFGSINAQTETKTKKVEIYKRYENGKLVEERSIAEEDGVPIENFDFENGIDDFLGDSFKGFGDFDMSSHMKDMSIKMKEIQMKADEMFKSAMISMEARMKEMQTRMNEKLDSHKPENQPISPNQKPIVNTRPSGSGEVFI